MTSYWTGQFHNGWKPWSTPNYNFSDGAIVEELWSYWLRCTCMKINDRLNLLLSTYTVTHHRKSIWIRNRFFSPLIMESGFCISLCWKSGSECFSQREWISRVIFVNAWLKLIINVLPIIAVWLKNCHINFWRYEIFTVKAIDYFSCTEYVQCIIHDEIYYSTRNSLPRDNWNYIYMYVANKQIDNGMAITWAFLLL